MKFIFILFSVLLTMCCNKENSFAGDYPLGITSFNQSATNNCLLPACSENRVVRFIAKNVEGEILSNTQGDFLVLYPFTFDSYITFRFCNLPVQFQQEGLKIKFDGYLLDLCGVYIPEWPEEETYILRISKISLL